MKSEILPANRLIGKTDGAVIRNIVLPGEIEGALIEYISLKGENQLNEEQQPDYYSVLLSLKGEALLFVKGEQHEIATHFIVKIPYNEPFSVHIEKGDEFHFLFIRRQLYNNDLNLISQNPGEHSSLYLKALTDCTSYTQDIISSKTINRMVLPVGLVPRLCMGSVEAIGPDSVGEHEHPMLDQLFLGLSSCKCTCHAGDENILLSENMMLHIPHGSKHSASVNEGDLLSYIWIDFFFTLNGQGYIEETHKMDNKGF